MRFLLLSLCAAAGLINVMAHNHYKLKNRNLDYRSVDKLFHQYADDGLIPHNAYQYVDSKNRPLEIHFHFDSTNEQRHFQRVVNLLDLLPIRKIPNYLETPKRANQNRKKVPILPVNPYSPFGDRPSLSVPRFGINNIYRGTFPLKRHNYRHRSPNPFQINNPLFTPQHSLPLNEPLFPSPKTLPQKNPLFPSPNTLPLNVPLFPSPQKPIDNPTNYYGGSVNGFERPRPRVPLEAKHDQHYHHHYNVFHKK